MPNKTLDALAVDLANGRTSSRQLVEECLAGTNHSMRRFFRLAHKRGFAEARLISAADHQQFRNLNSPADLEAPKS